MARVLVVEDDAVLANLIQETLKAEYHDVELAFNGGDGLQLIERFEFDLLVLDWELPQTSGIQLCHTYRNKGGVAPVIFITARSSIDDKETGFETGADDYLSKPFSMRELAMRARALLRRTLERDKSQASGDLLRYGEIELEPRKGLVRKAGREIRLQPRELALLEFFMRNVGLVFSSSALIDRVWKLDTEATDISVRSCIAKLRKKLEVQDTEKFIENQRGLGYRLPSE
ncbi:MAG: response regulator transcription factor [Cyanobacteria bacterium]|nr:response regulator transcription factor [Cyanobacteriota bacterium]